MMIKPANEIPTSSITLTVNQDIFEQIKHYCEREGIYDWGHFVEEAAALFLDLHQEYVAGH